MYLRLLRRLNEAYYAQRTVNIHSASAINKLKEGQSIEMFKILTAIGAVVVVVAVVYWVFKYFKDDPFRIIEEILDWWSSK